MFFKKSKFDYSELKSNAEGKKERLVEEFDKGFEENYERIATEFAEEIRRRVFFEVEYYYQYHDSTYIRPTNIFGKKYVYEAKLSHYSVIIADVRAGSVPIRAGATDYVLRFRTFEQKKVFFEKANSILAEYNIKVSDEGYSDFEVKADLGDLKAQKR